MRIVFEDISEFKNWINEFVKPGKHSIYITKSNEVVIVPRVSTNPIIYAYMKLSGEISGDLLPEEVPKYRIKSFDWKDDVPIGISFLGE